MKIGVITCFFNEEFLVPFFLRHYACAVGIHAIVTPGTDRTLELLSADSRVQLHTLSMPHGFDDCRKTDKINSLVAALALEYDWLVVVDSDEFVWPGGRPEGVLSEELASFSDNDTVVTARMWQVFRHASDADLNPELPPALQRRHGIPDREGPGVRGYCKPCVIRTNRRIQFGAGQHNLLPGFHGNFSEKTLDGAHWRMADPSFVRKRCLVRRDSLSRANRENELGTYVLSWTEQGLLAECAVHVNDPQLF
jgi:hypothetical protein